MQQYILQQYIAAEQALHPFTTSTQAPPVAPAPGQMVLSATKEPATGFGVEHGNASMSLLGVWEGALESIGKFPVYLEQQ